MSTIPLENNQATATVPLDPPKIHAYYHLTDEDLEQSLKPYLEMASIITGAEISYFSIFDQNKQYFVSTKGFKSQPINRSSSICNITLEVGAMLVIEDLSKDDRIPQGYEEHGFYVGIPIINTNNETMGTYCVLGNQPKVFDVNQRTILNLLGLQLVDYLERRKTLIDIYREWDHTQKKLNSELYDMQKTKYRIAHDLKGPVGTLTGLTELALTSEQVEASNDLKKLMGTIHTASDKVQTMLTDMLQQLVAENDEGQEKKKQVETSSLEKTIDAILELNDFQALYGKYRVSMIDLPSIETSPTDIYLIMQNLIENGLKYNDSEVKEVIISADHHQPKEYVITVQDNGVGIPKDKTHSIFEPKERLDNGLNKPGNGLGLYNVKTLLEEYGNKIWVEPCKTGSRFRFTWQRKDA